LAAQSRIVRRGHEDAVMPRRIRPIVPGVAHHVTQRAAHGRFILDSAHAKAVLADLITTWASKTGVVICGFVIMDNHFHLCAIPPDAHALSVMMGRVTAFFSKWLNLSAGDSVRTGKATSLRHRWTTSTRLPRFAMSNATRWPRAWWSNRGIGVGRAPRGTADLDPGLHS
jgi:REP element-mobilizing transposase RayT